MLKIFSKKDKKDKIRMHEHLHEERLKKRLRSFGIKLEFDEISHYGLTLKNSFENNLIEK